jgi:hypothetical protein
MLESLIIKLKIAKRLFYSMLEKYQFFFLEFSKNKINKSK